MKTVVNMTTIQSLFSNKSETYSSNEMPSHYIILLPNSQAYIKEQVHSAVQFPCSLLLRCV